MKILTNLADFKKKIFILKMEDFFIEDERLFVRNVYGLYFHQKDSYEGYELRVLAKTTSRKY